MCCSWSHHRRTFRSVSMVFKTSDGRCLHFEIGPITTRLSNSTEFRPWRRDVPRGSLRKPSLTVDIIKSDCCHVRQETPSLIEGRFCRWTLPSNHHEVPLSSKVGSMCHTSLCPIWALFGYICCCICPVLCFEIAGDQAGENHHVGEWWSDHITKL